MQEDGGFAVLFFVIRFDRRLSISAASRASAISALTGDLSTSRFRIEKSDVGVSRQMRIVDYKYNKKTSPSVTDEEAR